MYGKIVELMFALERGVEARMINAKRVNRLYKSLINEEVKGTKII